MKQYKPTQTFIGKIVSLVIFTVVLFAILTSYINIDIQTTHLQEDIQKSKEQFLEVQKENVFKQVHLMNDTISFHAKQSKKILKIKITERIETAYKVVQNIYAHHTKTDSLEEINREISATLSAISYNNTEDYIYVYDYKNHIMLAHGNPKFVGKDMRNFQDKHGVNILKSIEKLFEKNRIAYTTNYFIKPNNAIHEYPKLSAAIKFEPLQIAIGTGMYLDKVRENQQQFVLERFKHFSHEHNSYLFMLNIHNIEGGNDFATMILNSNRPDLLNQKISDSHIDTKGKAFRQEMLKKLREKGEGYVEYWYKKPGTLQSSRKLSYFYLQKEWNWIVGSGFYFDDLEKEIATLEKEMKLSIDDMIISSIMWTFILLLFIIPLAIIISVRIDKTIDRYAGSLLAQKNFLNSLLDLLPIPIFAKGIDGKYILINRAFEKLTGYEGKDILNKGVYDIAPRDIAKIYDDQDQRVFTLKEQLQVYQSQVVHKSNTTKNEVIFYKSPFLMTKNRLMV
jgi:PAS domain S-box-containing protein